MSQSNVCTEEINEIMNRVQLKEEKGCSLPLESYVAVCGLLLLG